ncbi:unnamed protein product [Pedinophyceae sp. YPF-701]|nr:unnamed protein product [Pedinophyceae sp. YPF-701]
MGRCSEMVCVGGVQLQGISVGGVETCIILPQFNVAFDIGRCPQRAVYQDTVLITHAHMDHIGGINFHIASRQLLSLPPPTVVLPTPNVPAVEALLAAHRELDGCDMRVNLVPARPADKVEVQLKKGGCVARCFPTIHPVPSQGYAVITQKRKLKPEYHGLPGREIAALRRDGVEVSDVVEVAEVAFSGDTTGDFLLLNKDNPDVRHAKLLIMECTFVEDGTTMEDAEKFGHTHVGHVLRPECLEVLRDVGHVLFIHFSARYRVEDVEANMRERLPGWLLQKSSFMTEGFGARHGAHCPPVLHGADMAAALPP